MSQSMHCLRRKCISKAFGQIVIPQAQEQFQNDFALHWGYFGAKSEESPNLFELDSKPVSVNGYHLSTSN